MYSCRYNHDSSETTEDTIAFIATDGTNSVSFSLPVKVNPQPEKITEQKEICNAYVNLSISMFVIWPSDNMPPNNKIDTSLSIGKTHQWWAPSVGYWFETSSQVSRRRRNNHHFRVHLCYWCWQRQQQPRFSDCPATLPWGGPAKRHHCRSLHPSRHHSRHHLLQTHR